MKTSVLIALNLLCFPLVLGFSVFFILIVGIDLLIVIVAAVVFGAAWLSFIVIWAIFNKFFVRKEINPLSVKFPVIPDDPKPDEIPVPDPLPDPVPIPDPAPIKKMTKITEDFYAKIKQDNLKAEVCNTSPTASSYESSCALASTLEGRLINKVYPDLDNTKFNEKLAELEQKSEVDDEKWKLETQENSKKSKFEFGQKIKEKDEECAQILKKHEEEILEIQRETEEIENKRIEQQDAVNAAFINCLLLEQHFEKEEQKFSDWLDFVRSPIAVAIRRFDILKKMLKSLKRNSGKTYDKVLKNELKHVHFSTLTAYNTVYNAWCTAKNLLGQYPEKIFLAILKSRLKSIVDQLFTVLELIDHRKNQPLSILTEIQNSFNSIQLKGVPKIWELREESKTAVWKDYEIEEDPMVYRGN